MEEIKAKEFIPKPIQVKFAKLYLDTQTRLTHEQIAKELGINRRTIYNWLNNKEFKDWLNSKRLELIDNSLIDIYRVAVEKAKKGDYNFCKMLLEISGDYQPGMKLNTIGSQELIKIEVVQSQLQAQKQGDDNEDH